MSNGVSIVYAGNTAILRVSGVRDHNGVYKNDATVELISVTNKATGLAVSNLTVPATLAYVSGSDGNYEIVMAYLVGFQVGQVYRVVVRATSVEGYRGEWIENVRAKNRSA